MSVSSKSAARGVAIVGIGCRYPGGVRGPASFLRFLEQNGDGIGAVPADRWDVERYSGRNKNVPGRGYVRAGGFLSDDVFEFDPAAFGISPREAEYLDPQQRLLLETTIDALDDARLEVADLRGSNTGTYIGAFNVDVRDIVSHPGNARKMSAHTATGASHTVLSNRLSYTFDWHGPSFTVDTACSSSLVTTHYACRDLLDGKVDLAIAGGVNVMLSPVSTNIMCKGQFLAPDGRSKAFDANADGYGRGEGTGLVVLKRLEDAVRDGDRIYAVIRASGVNQDGKTDGLPMPNGKAQSDLCRSVVQAAGVAPTDVGFVEAHGTGTRAGDPIETRALSEVYCGEGRSTPLPISSVKTNIGHLEAAAGVTGLIKAALSVHHGKILPLRAIGEVNPAIELDAWKLSIPTEVQEWTGPRIAAVNSFGYGGTNAHAIVSAPELCLDESSWPEPSLPSHATLAPNPEPSTTRPPLQAALLTAHDREALSETARSVLSAPDRQATLRSLTRHRRTLPVRAFLHDLTGEMDDVLQCLAEGKAHERLTTGNVVSEQPRVLWVFTGMGPQWWAMGRELLEKHPLFRAAADRVDAQFRAVSGWSIVEEMLKGESESRMSRNSIAQPANFVMQVGLVELLRHHGVPADGYLGHSVGELAAAWASGALDLKTAATLAFHRSDLQQQAAGQGTMAALEISVDEADRLCREIGNLSIAAINGEQSVALAGGVDEIEQAVARIAGEGRFAKRMHVEVAYHSHQMDPLREGFASRLADLPFSAPQAPLYSTARGERVSQPTHDASYWWDNARRPVQLARAVRLALEDGYDLVLEVGPHPVLAQSIKALAAAEGLQVAQCFTQRRGRAADVTFVESLGSLACAGVSVDWKELLGQGPSASLPLYPFQRRRFWFEGQSSHRISRPTKHPLLDRQLDGQTVFQTELAGTALEWIADHRVQEVEVFPGAGYIEAALAISQELLGESATQVVEQLRFESPLVVSSDAPPLVCAELRDGRIEIVSENDGQRTRHARGRLSGRSRYRTPPSWETTSGEWDSTSGEWTPLSVEELYAGFRARGLDYGPRFRLIEELRRKGDCVEARIGYPEVAADYLCFPGILDAAFQALLSLLPAEMKGAVVPVSLRSVRCHRPVRGPVRMTGRAQFEGEDLQADLSLYDENGQPLLVIEQLVCRPVDRAGIPRAESTWHHEKNWTAAGPVPTVASFSGERAIVVVESERHAALVQALRDAGRTVVETLQELGNVAAQVVLCVDDDCSVDGAVELRALHLLGMELSRRAGMQLVLLCSRAYRVDAEDDVQPAQAALVGLARVFMTEYPQLDTRVIDARPEAQSEELARLLSSAEWTEEELALRAGQTQALRIERDRSARERRLDERRPPNPGEAYELFVERPGRVDSLGYRPVHFEGPLPAGHVEIDIQAASVNFKDVMKALGALEGRALENTYLGDRLGLDAAGVVTAKGAGVSDVEVGDLVFAFAPGALASRLRVDSRYVVRAAQGHQAEDACSYAVYQTVWLGVMQRAQLQPGESILIHSAAGAVGLCALQLALHVGATVYATAGTEEKRAYLRELGVEHVYDSRTLDFSGQILRDSRGRGVDVVLNSLAGDAFLHNLDVLAPGGRLVELGKQDFARDTSIPLGVFNRAISLIAVDMDRMAYEQPGYYKPVAQAVVNAFEQGIFRPLPRKVLPAAEAEEAFRLLGSGSHVGKIVLDFQQPVPFVRPGCEQRSLCRSSGTYLVTGGLGGFGLRTARFLVQQGAGHVVLASRRGRVVSDELLALERLAEERGARVSCAALDVSEPEQVSELVKRLLAGEQPLRGVVHSAMVLDDAPLDELSFDSLARVMNAKAIGAWNLHEAVGKTPLEFFVLYSSVSAIVGNPGQAAYAAANCYLDGLAQHRRAHGLVATSIQWGAIADVGVVARDAQVETHLRSIGIEPLDPDRALAGLVEALQEDATERGIIDIDWDRWMRTTPDTRWNRLALLSSGEEAADGAQAQLVARLVGAEDAEQLVVTELSLAVAPVFKMEAEQLDPDKALKDFGLDSLMALEVQVAIETSTGVEISTMELLAGRSLRAVAQTVLARLPLGETAGGVQVPAGGVQVSASGVQVPASGAVSPANDTASSPERTDSGRPAANASGAAWRQYFLERIGVQPPYFALTDIESPRPDEAQATWRAQAEPVPPSELEASSLALAEAARHATILASCAVRDRMGGDGRIYFPVRAAELIREADLDGLAVRRVELRAVCVELDTRNSQAVCTAAVHRMNGEEICCFRVTLHIIPEENFHALFRESRQPLATRASNTHAANTHAANDSSVADPYREWSTLPPITVLARSGSSVYQVDRGIVAVESCAGHFDEYPAYPVSIMARDAVSLVAQALHLEGQDGAQIRVTGGTCSTSNFVFAGQRLVLQAELLSAGDRQQWLVQFKSEGRVCAEFAMQVEVTEAISQAYSEVVGPPDDLDLLA